jgi:hypothetical protein
MAETVYNPKRGPIFVGPLSKRKENTVVKFVKLTRFDINTEWNQGVPTNTEVRKPVYINAENVQIVQVRDFFVPTADEDNKYIEKVLITFGMDMDIFVDEPIEEVLAALDVRQPYQSK